MRSRSIRRRQGNGCPARTRSRSIADAPTHVLGRLADAVRARKHPGRIVTYIIDRNVNYTNVCVARCNFCAFYRPVGSSEGYVLGFEEIFRKIDETIAVGGNQLLLQGGHNPDLPLTWYEDLFRAVKAALSRVQAARALAARGHSHLAAFAAAGAGGDRTPRRRGARQHPRRRRRDPRRPRPHAAALLRQGDRRRVARRHAPRASRGSSHDGDDDVRHGRDARGAARAPVPAARSAGRDRRLHGVHHLELPARSHRARRDTASRPRPPASSTCARSRSRGSCSTTSTTCSPRGSRRAARSAAQPRVRRQ